MGVPEPVAEEIRRRGPADVTARALAETPWIEIVPVPSVPPIIGSWDLGPGESAVLAWAASHPGTTVIVDDLAARRCAAALALPVHGTLGLVLLAKRRGVIPAARPVLDELIAAGMYLSPSVIAAALALVGE